MRSFRYNGLTLMGLSMIFICSVSAAAKEKKTMTYNKPPVEEIKKRLSPLQCQVTQDGATEKPFQNEFWDHKKPGIYVDVVSGEPLFSSTDKYDSGSGWPSFTKPLVAPNIKEKADKTHGMERTEIRSKYADSHLGHVFDDGPGPTGLRYCVNSASLRFVPVDALEKEGYGEFKSLFMSTAAPVPVPAPGPVTAVAKTPSGQNWPVGDFAAKVKPGQAVATLAGGCFWGMEDIIRGITGVIETQVGYTGGSKDHATYKDVTSGKTGHAESVQILFDPAKLSYDKLLEWFFKMHDPTTMNQQGNDRGTQYRSAVFVYDDNQRQVAKAVIERTELSGKWKKPIVTEIVDAKPFWIAEEYHQDYLVKNPNGYTCHYLRD